jgi:hypothetical protein
MPDAAPEVHRAPVLSGALFITLLGILIAIPATPVEKMHEFIHWLEHIPENLSLPDFGSYIKNFFEHAAERRGIVIDDIVKNAYPAPVLQADDIPLERPTFTRDVPAMPATSHSHVVAPTEVHDPHEGAWHLSQIAHVTTGAPTDTELASLQRFLSQHGVTVSDDVAREYFARGSYSVHGVQHSLWKSSFRDTQIIDKDGITLAAFFSTPRV